MPRSGLDATRRVMVPPTGFNEAGAIMPRSGVRPAHKDGRVRMGFNEAGAIMPRSGRIGVLHTPPAFHRLQ